MQKKCYFGCKVIGQLHSFPSPRYPHVERFTKWKSVLNDDLRNKDDLYIHNNVRLCRRHFENYYYTRGGRLTPNSFPTLNLSMQQEQVTSPNCDVLPQACNVTNISVQEPSISSALVPCKLPTHTYRRQKDRDAATAAPAHEDVLPDAPPPPPAVAPSSNARAAEQIAGPSNVIPPINYTAPSVPCTEETGESNEDNTGQSEIIDLLGADPSVAQEFGDEINKEVASRFERIATTGLEKQVRQELIQKFLVPCNCTKIAAPMLNAEIKAASGETVVKRDKAIEYRQKQLAAAIAGIGRMLTSQLRNKENNNLSKQLMEIGHILCDIQHSESLSRRNFALYSLKKDFREQLSTTKIDKYLFGVDLPETLKTAKAVCESGTDMKDVQKQKQKPKTLNWKAGPSVRSQPKGPIQKTQPAAPASRRATSSHKSSHRHKSTRRR